MGYLAFTKKKNVTCQACWRSVCKNCSFILLLYPRPRSVRVRNNGTPTLSKQWNQSKWISTSLNSWHRLACLGINMFQFKTRFTHDWNWYPCERKLKNKSSFLSRGDIKMEEKNICLKTLENCNLPKKSTGSTIRIIMNKLTEKNNNCCFQSWHFSIYFVNKKFT